MGPDAPWHQRVLVKHRRLIGILIPFLFFQISWWLLAYRWNLWTLFPERWILSVTMIFGASVAGKTQKFSAILILREIKLADFRKSKAAVLAILETLNFDFCEFHA